MNLKNFYYILAFIFICNSAYAEDTEEVISVASYIDSTESSTSPVDVISAEDYKKPPK